MHTYHALFASSPHIELESARGVTVLMIGEQTGHKSVGQRCTMYEANATTRAPEKFVRKKRDNLIDWYPRAGLPRGRNSQPHE